VNSDRYSPHYSDINCPIYHQEIGHQLSGLRALRDLTELVEMGIFEQQGAGRGSSYKLLWPDNGVA